MLWLRVTLWCSAFWARTSIQASYRQLDSYADRYCCRPHCSGTVANHVDTRFVENCRDSLSAALRVKYKKGDAHDLYNHYRSNRTVFDWLLAIKAATGNNRSGTITSSRAGRERLNHQP